MIITFQQITQIFPMKVGNCIIDHLNWDGKIFKHNVEAENTEHVYGTQKNNILSKTIENTNSDENEDKPQKKKEIIVVSIQQTKYALRTLKQITTATEDNVFSALSNLKKHRISPPPQKKCIKN